VEIFVEKGSGFQSVEKPTSTAIYAAMAISIIISALFSMGWGLSPILMEPQMTPLRYPKKWSLYEELFAQ
jgi:hypothetical protein